MMTGRVCKICHGTGMVNMGPINPGGPSIKEKCYGPECDYKHPEDDNRPYWEKAGFKHKDHMLNAACGNELLGYTEAYEDDREI